MKKVMIPIISAALLAATLCIFRAQTPKHTGYGADEAAVIQSCAVTVKEYREKIGLFNAGDDEPFSVINVFTFTLPEKDRAQLKDGFLINEDDITGVVEDYTG